MSSLIFSVLKSFCKGPDELKLQYFDKVDSSNNCPASIHLERLAAPSDTACLPAIEYAYDPLPALPVITKQRLRSLPSGATASNSSLSLNSVQLDPLSAGLPYRCGIDHARASRFWATNLGETVNLLGMLAMDDSPFDVEVEHGITVAKLARKALQPGLEQRIVLSTHYMFPGADENRIKQIAALMIIYFVYDDKFEETPTKTLHTLHEDYLGRIDGYSSDSTPSALQSHFHEIVHGIESEDEADGDGGKDMMSALRDAFRLVVPDKGFRDINDYFPFRRVNIGATFVFAAAKFSIKSRVSLSDARFQHYLSLVGDHLSIVNDLYSYDKELHAFNNGEASDVVNLVALVKSVTSLQDTDDAKSVAWALLLQVEKQMMEELKNLRAQNLSNEEWWFLEAVTCTATGNVMFCMTSSRYGGEAARIRKGNESTELSLGKSFH